jgi:hypothetical protein
MSNNNYYLGNDPYTRLGDTPRFFYGLRKNSNGSLFLERSDQLKNADSITINNPGEESENYTDFEVGVDFFEGIDINHNAVFDNLKYQQYRWDDRAIFYYVNDDGELVARVNNGYEYTPGTSED